MAYNTIPQVDIFKSDISMGKEIQTVQEGIKLELKLWFPTYSLFLKEITVGSF